MTALAVRAAHDSHLSWPRVGAWSGSFSVHLVILALLLAPPTAIELVRRVTPVVPTVRLIEEVKPKVVDEPPLPYVKPHTQSQTVVHHDPVQAHLNTEPTAMSKSDPIADGDKVSIDTPTLTAVDSEPSAIQYGTKTGVAYPRESRINHEQGTVTLRVFVGSDGAVQAVEVAKSSGWPRLDRAARDAVSRWSFHPAMQNGVAHSAWALVPITFNLSML